MNLCRTCKYWGVYAGAVGYGACTNIETLCNVNIGEDRGFRTSQDFGCPFHSPSDQSSPSIYSVEEQRKRAFEFYKERQELQSPT